MRAMIVSGLIALMLPGATLAADLDFGMLRGTEFADGSEHAANWAGPYIGGFAGYSQSNFGNRNGSKDLVADYYKMTTVESEYGVSSLLQLKSKNARDTTFGGFAGYNFQYDDVVLGFEADYASTKLRGTSSDAISRFMTTSDGYYNLVRLQGSGTTQLGDYGTIRARAGYTWGSLMPFVTGGVALGQLKTSNSATIQSANYNISQVTDYLAGTGPFPSNSGYSAFAPSAPTAFACTSNTSCLRPAQTFTKSKSTVAVGLTAGAGLEFLVTQNIFLRAEYQYAFFNDFDGHKFNLNVARAGAGVKF